ncbi:unnamed protein product [Sphagnum troendelagicum]|uniref:Uncharacterized protein n=1 Tax=Sphagnum troendelagicum TaxID=128251 RepID=A0ABP0TP52_9BRYO
MADTLNSNVLEIEEDPSVTGQVTSFKSTTQRSRSEVAPPRPLSCYGSAPEEFWSELSSRNVQDQSCDLVETLKKRPGWTEIIESLSKELESHRPPGQGPRFYRRMKVGIPKAEDQTTIVALSSSSSASPVSLGMRASRSRMESLPNCEHQTPGSFSSTGLLKMQQQGTGPVKSHALPTIWEEPIFSWESYNFTKLKKISVWRELLQGFDIPNGEPALKALMPREVARALEDIAAVEVNITSRYREAIAGWYAAMETWLPRTPQAIPKCFTVVDYGISFDHLWDKIRDVSDAWREESPVEFQAWKEAVEEACRQNAVYHKTDMHINWIKYPRVKVISALEAEMNAQLREFFNFLLGRAKFKFQELESPRAV